MSATMQAFKMPDVKIGMTVLFYVGADPNQIPMAGIVTGAGSRSLVLNVLDKATYNLLIRDGVRHMTDPDLAHNTETRMMGGWDYTDESKRLMAIEEQVRYLMNQDVPSPVSSPEMQGHMRLMDADQPGKRGPRPKKEVVPSE